MFSLRRSLVAVGVACLAGVVIVGGVSAPAGAAVPSDAAPVVTYRGDGSVRIDVIAPIPEDPRIEKILAFVSEHDGVSTLDYPGVRAAGIDQDFLDEFVTTFVREGGLAAGVGESTGDNRPLSRQKRSGCVGRNRAWDDFWGKHIEMDSCAVTEIADRMRGGGGIASAAGFILIRIPGAGTVVGSIISAGGILTSLGGNVLHACGFPDGRPRGATLHITGVPWCGSQS